MSGQLLAEFDDPDSLVAAMEQVRRAGGAPVDAFTPFPLDGIADRLGAPPARLRLPMLIAGVLVGGFAYGLQWCSAVVDYPLNVGGRPLHSWPVFLLAPFEVGVFAAALAGCIGLLRYCGLPRLHHPIFAVPGIERASQDRFFLLAGTQGSVVDLRRVLEQADALRVTELRP